MSNVHFTIWLISDDPNWPARPRYQARLDGHLIENWMPGTLVPGAPPKSVFVVRSRPSGQQTRLRVSANNGSANTTLQVMVVRGDGSVPVNQIFDVPFNPITLSFTA